MDEAHITHTLQHLYWRAGGRQAACAMEMLQRIADDASRLHRLSALPADLEDIVIATLEMERETAMPDAELRRDLLEMACEAGYPRLAALLLRAGPAPDDTQAAQCMVTAIRAGHAPVLAVLLRAGLPADGHDASGAPLLSHAIAAGDSAIIALLTQAGARPDQEGHALSTAAIAGDTSLLQLCLVHGATQRALDEAFGMAAAAGRQAAMVMLLDAGASSAAALQHARQRGDADMAALIRSALFTQGQYEQLVQPDDLRAVAQALSPRPAEKSSREGA